MTPLELCDPLFLYICRLNRLARKGTHHEYSQIRADVEAIFEQMRSRAASEPGMEDQFNRLEMPLMFFADSVISEMQMPAAEIWRKNRMAFERNELAGDEKFWDVLDEALKDRSAAATDRLAVFYVCIGLGFGGFYAGQPEYLRKKMLECQARIGKQMDADQTMRLCPEAYERVDTRILIEPPGRKLGGIVLVLIALIITLFVCNVVLFRSASSKLRQALAAVRETEKKARLQDGPALSKITSQPDDARVGH